ncbi:MAG: zinc ribbon domain-containing protein [Micropruina sp.]|uniref:FmdB family zinc ribbon protein n=1 Tax=Micropruina sp. TaxID=2737536 RepID=UPI0039E5576D
MPTYQYRCLDCSSQHEVVQKFTDDPLTECPDCEGSLRKVYSAVGVVFKGSGFYATDNRAKKKAGASAGGTSSSNGSSTASSSGSGDSKPSGGADKPAAASPASSGAPAA